MAPPTDPNSETEEEQKEEKSPSIQDYSNVFSSWCNYIDNLKRPSMVEGSTLQDIEEELWTIFKTAKKHEWDEETKRILEQTLGYASALGKAVENKGEELDNEDFENLFKLRDGLGWLKTD